MKTLRLLTWLSSLLVEFLTGAAFVLSYSALRALAGRHGIAANLTWLWPLTVDGFLIVASLAVLRKSLLGERALYQWALVGLFTLLSIGFNILHAPRNSVAQIIGAVPPVALFLAFELLMGQLRSNFQRQRAISTLADLAKLAERKRAELAQQVAAADAQVAERQAQVAAMSATADTLGSKVADLQAQLEALRRARRALPSASLPKMAATLGIVADADEALALANATRLAQADAARQALLAFFASQPTATQEEAAQAIGKSRQWVGQALTELEAAGLIKRNGRTKVLAAPTA